MFCRKCGKALSDDAVFCKYCGEKIKIQDNYNSAQKLPMTGKLDIVSRFPVGQVGVKGIVALCLAIFVIIACFMAVDFYGWPISQSLKEVNFEGYKATYSLLSPVEMYDKPGYNHGKDVKRYLCRSGSNKNFICEIREIEFIDSDVEISNSDLLMSIAQQLEHKTSNFSIGKFEKANIGKIKGTKMNATYTFGENEYKVQYIAFHKNTTFWCINIGYRTSRKDGEKILEQVIDSIEITPKK